MLIRSRIWLPHRHFAQLRLHLRLLGSYLALHSCYLFTELHHRTSQRSSQIRHHPPTMDTSGRLTAAPNASTQDNGSAYASSVAQSILFKLPRELRDYIYEYAFCGRRFIITEHGGVPEPALLSVCRLIRDEAVPLFYCHESRLTLYVVSWDPAVLELWKTKYIHLQRSHGIFASGANLHHVGVRNWNNLKRFLQLIHANGITRFRRHSPDSPSYTDEKFFISGLFTVAAEMDNRSWEAVEAVLDMLRPGLVKLHRDWSL